MIIFYFVILFLLGLSIGSFLNVVIDRLPLGQNLRGRSVSDCCSEILGVWDLVPVVSFLLSRGLCRHCQQKISLYYPLVELLTAVLFVLSFFSFPLPYSVFYAICFCFLIVFFFTDLKYGVVPIVVFSQGLLYVSLVYLFLFFSSSIDLDFLITAYTAAAVAAVFFVFLILITKGRGMGGGDVLLVFLFSLMLGFPKSLVMIFLSFILGGIFSSILLLLKKKHFGQSLPFGPFMALAVLVSLYWGNSIIGWYLGL